MVYVVTNEYERANGIDQQCYAGRQFREEAKPESTTEDANKYVKPPMDNENGPTMLFRDCNITINFGNSAHNYTGS